MVTSEALRDLSFRRARHRNAEALLGLRDYVARYRSELIEQMDQPGACGVALARRHAAIADELARSVFEQARVGCGDTPLLLGAVGGYGRGLLALGSDLDLCFITNAPAEAVTSCVEAMLYPLWDAGVRVGHQVVWPSEVVCDATADLTIATELLDFRPLVGDVSLMQSVEERLKASIFSESKVGSFILQLEAGTKKRHQLFGDSVYLLEPDLKNGAGGLRDLDSALWACRARFGTSDLGALAALGVISPQSQAETQRALEFLWTVRNHLHRALGRKADRLTFGEQERVAYAMGYAPEHGQGMSELRRTGEMVEAFMSDYYRHARVIAQTRARLLGRAKRRSVEAQPRVTQLGGGLVECDGSIGLAEPERIRSEPTLAFQVYGVALGRDMAVLSHTRDAIARATQDEAFSAELRASRQAAELFVALVCSSRPAPFPSGSVLTELHDVGLLLAMIPEFVPVVGRVHHDLYHVYTVDVHSIAAVDRLHALVRGDLATAFPLASRLAAETVRPRVLFLATLLHDIGKAIGGRNHARRGADMARPILERLYFAADEIADASRLIRHHLTMYMVAIRRDLNDPGTISEFVSDTWDRESLRELFLLTVADVSTTSAEAMTNWKRSMLDALFRSSDAFLAGSLVGPSDRVDRVKGLTRALWREPSTLEELDRFLGSMPARYFLANTPEEVVAHAELALRRGVESVGVSWVPSSHDGILGLCVVAPAHIVAPAQVVDQAPIVDQAPVVDQAQVVDQAPIVAEAQDNVDLCVVAEDRLGLLASIAAAISANHFDIQAAQVNSRPLPGGGYQAVDLFWVRSPAHEGAKQRRLAQLKRDLAAVVRGDVSPEALVEGRLAASRSRRPTPAVVTEVLFDHHASSQYTVIEVLAEDRPALLFTLAAALSELGVSISIAKISTEGKRAVDVLYATEANGTRIAPGARTEQIRARLLEALGAGGAG